MIHRSGRLEVITGPMFAGKSEELIRRLRRAQIARLPVKVFKHALDARYSEDHVVSHSEWKFSSKSVEQASAIPAQIISTEGVVGIDEAQFFGADLVGAACDLASRGMRVIVAGLDMDSSGRPFGPMPHLMALAEEVTKMHAICMRCGEAAHFTQRLAPGNDPVLVGGKESYEARCRTCFHPSDPGMPTSA